VGERRFVRRRAEGRKRIGRVGGRTRTRAQNGIGRESREKCRKIQRGSRESERARGRERERERETFNQRGRLLPPYYICNT
jgi:hypothetical protein